MNCHSERSEESWFKLLLLCCFLLVCIIACGPPGAEKYRMTDAELRLTESEAQGRHIFNARCLPCHEAYIAKGRNGPTLKGVYKKPFLPSGTPANNERIGEVILRGKRMMPPTPLTDAQLKALL